MRLTTLIVAAALPLTAVIIDKIAVTVGNQAITQIEITREIRLAALVNGDKPDNGPESRRKAADELLEQALVHREMTFGSYPPVPAAQVEASMTSTEKARGGASALDQQLRENGLTRDELHAYLEWQIALLKFIDLRFRPSVQVTREDVAKYYAENAGLLPKVNGEAPSLHDVHNLIEQKLTGERVDAQVDQWLKETRAHTLVRYIDPSLAPVAQAGIE